MDINERFDRIDAALANIAARLACCLGPSGVPTIVASEGTSALLVEQHSIGFPKHTLGSLIDTEFIVALHAMTGVSFQRSTTVSGCGNIVVALTSEAAVQAASSSVQAFANEIDQNGGAAHGLFTDGSGNTWLLGHNYRGALHAIYALLDVLGARALGPAAGWYHLPQQVILPPPALRRLFHTPLLRFRNIGNGSMGGYHRPPLPLSEKPKYEWQQWERRSRQPSEFGGMAATHLGEAFNATFQCQLRANRNMLAWSSEARGLNPKTGKPFPSNCFSASAQILSKIDYTHSGDGSETYPEPPSPPWLGVTVAQAQCVPGATDCNSDDARPDSGVSENGGVYSGWGGVLKLLGEWAAHVLCVQIQKYGPDHSVTRFGSVAPADGGEHCECDKCLNLLRSGPYKAYLSAAEQAQDSSIADRVFHQANEVQKFFKHWFVESPRSVSTTSYSHHAQIPRIPIEEGMHVAVAPSSMREPLRERAFLEAWVKKRDSNPLGPFVLGDLEAWLSTHANFDLPRLSAHYALDHARWVRENGYASLTIMGSWAQGPLGPHLYGISRIAWDPKPTNEKLLDEYFSLAYGPAAPEVRAMYERWWSGYYLTPHQVHIDCQRMITAREALGPTPDPDHDSRLTDLIGYVQYLRLYHEYLDPLLAHEAGSNATTAKALEKAAEPLFHHIWAIFRSNMTASFRLHEKFAFDVKDLPISARWDVDNESAPGWATVVEWNRNRADASMLSGSQVYAREPGVTRKVFGGPVTPIIESLDAAPVASPVAVATKDYWLYKASNNVATIEVEISEARSGVLRVQLFDSNGHLVTSVDVPGSATGKTPLTLPQGAGLYEVRCTCRNVYVNFKLHVPRNLGFGEHGDRVMRRGFDTTRKVYFRVPPGTTRIALNLDSHNTVQFYDQQDQAVAMATKGPRLWTADVPIGEDGGVWSFTGWYSRTNDEDAFFENCPNILSFDRAQVVVPADAR